MFKKKMDSKTFLFRKCLYSISNHLSQSDIDKLKFMLDDDIPRAQLEAASSGFDLFCLMEARNLVSQNGFTFLKDVLGTVSKEHYIDRYIAEVKASGGQVKGTVGVSCGTPPSGKDNTLKKLLGRLEDAMTLQNVHDLALFFYGRESSISLKEADKIRLASEVFQKLRGTKTICDGDVTALYNVLEVLGRLDLCSKIEEFYQHQDHVTSPLSEAVLESGNQHQPRPVFIGHGSSGGPKHFSPSSLDRDTTALQSECVSEQASLASRTTFPEMSSPSQHNQEVLQLEKQLAWAQKQLQSNRSYHNQVLELETALRTKVNEVSQLQSTNEQLVKSRRQYGVTYEMKRKPHGIAVIIVNGNFDANPEEPGLILNRRDGALKDLELFRSTFSFLGYDVETHYNKASFEMFEVIESVASSFDHSLYDSFVCCVSTHGSASGLYGADSVLVKIEEFKEPIKNIPTLVGKPKMFFIQSCRVKNAETVTADRPQPVAPAYHHDVDFYVVNATPPNNPAYISPAFGSWFCQALKKVFTNSQFAHTCTLQNMVNMVAQEITNCSGILEDGNTALQCLHREITLTKDVVFFQE